MTHTHTHKFSLTSICVIVKEKPNTNPFKFNDRRKVYVEEPSSTMEDHKRNGGRKPRLTHFETKTPE